MSTKEYRANRTPEQRARDAAYTRAWRAANPGYVRPSFRDTLAWYEELKREACVDCGGTYPAYVMDFDHRPGTKKVDGVSRMVREHRPLALIQAEVAKCDLVCCNCHRQRTHARGQFADSLAGRAHNREEN